MTTVYCVLLSLIVSNKFILSSVKNYDSDQMYAYMSPFNKQDPPVFPLGADGKFLTPNNIKRHSFNTSNKDILIFNR